MPEGMESRHLTNYFTACETLAESLFAEMPPEKRERIATWCAAIMESLEGEQISESDLYLILGSLAGLAVWETDVDEDINKDDVRTHARNLVIGSFERGCDGISAMDFHAPRTGPAGSESEPDTE